MTDELLLILANIGDISPKKVCLIIDAYEKATTGVKSVPEDFSVFEYKGRLYAYKSLGDGHWTSQCASLELMKVLKNYFISSGKMEKGGFWPGSSFSYAWTSDVYSYGYHVLLSSDGHTDYSSGGSFARFIVLPLDEDFTVFKYKGRLYAYKSLGDGPWTSQCASLELMKVLKNYFISSGKMVEGGCWPDSSCNLAWTRDVDSVGSHVVLSSDGYTYHSNDGYHGARFAVLPLDSERKIFKEALHENETI